MPNDPYKYFRVEARELLEELVKGVLDLEKGRPTSQVAARMLRHAHTLKGAARVIKQPDIADHSHAIEEALEPFRGSEAPVPPDRLDDVLGHLDRIRDQVVALPLPEEDNDAGPAGTPQPAEQVRTVRTDIVEMDGLLDRVAQAHAHLGPLRSALGRFERERTTELSPGEFRAAVAALVQQLANSVEQVDRELRQVSDAVERLRLVPAAALFTDLERAARDVAQAQGKLVDFEGTGGDVRLDAHVLAEVQGALQQVVRNAVAHGIETQSERTGGGKAPQGRVSLQVARRGRDVVFSCRDDGRGIDLDAVRSAGRRKGLLSEETDNLGPEALMALLLRGGISTSGSVTELSGRGIGLDLVRDSAARLGGEVTFVTAAAKGTTVELSVPLTLASFEALAVEASGATALIPLEAVTETLRVGPDEVQRGVQGQTLCTKGRVLPLVPLQAALAESSVGSPGDGVASVVIVAGAGSVAAVGVTRVLGIANVVVRPLPHFVPRARVVSGVWLNTEGSLCLVLDPDELVVEARRERAVGRQTELAALAPVLIVDDSLTTRMLERSILESAGYDVEVASSAEEALVKAKTTRYLLFLVDVEMPGMDGFAFVRRTRSDPGQRDVPAVLVTSRSSPEDRQQGLDAGASAYISKGEFDQGKLLDSIRALIGR
jgi:two-component system chemotaxis sensor kinase CheA